LAETSEKIEAGNAVHYVISILQPAQGSSFPRRRASLCDRHGVM
jgi:hypothetical protein